MSQCIIYHFLVYLLIKQSSLKCIDNRMSNEGMIVNELKNMEKDAISAVYL
jgi:hypothetical protein